MHSNSEGDEAVRVPSGRLGFPLAGKPVSCHTVESCQGVI